MVKKYIIGFIFGLVALTLITSCDQVKERSTKVRSIGNTSEILVVVENEHQWENSIGKVIRENLGRDQYGLNQAEPVFNLAHINKSSLSDLLRKHRNILIVEIDKNAAKPKIESSEDLWAKPQQVFKITAPSSAEFVTVFENNAELFEEKYSQTERDRILSVFRTSSNKEVAKKLKNEFGLNLTIPREFYAAKTEPGFMWIRKEVEKFSQGILVISYPYQDTAQFSQESIVSRINLSMQQYIPGSVDGSYMTTDDEFVFPQSVIVGDFITDFAVETVGLWKVENDFMGGPFVSYTFIDERKNTIVTILGYVYQPNKSKRDLLRQLEAIIYSTQFVS
jgi:hypothetical protein